MPNHWESSGRPLFVKTVFVDGNRHAILSRQDPLLRPGGSSSSSGNHGRPTSSLSSGTDFSVSGSESQESGPEDGLRKREKAGAPQEKDISAELQSCCRLVKLRLSTGDGERKPKIKNDVSDNSQRDKEQAQSLESSSFEKKRKRWSRSKTCGRTLEGNANEKNLDGCSNGRDCRYYLYDLANVGGKKNYCFVKISSKPSRLILNCSCGNNFCGSRESPAFSKNLLVSASFHNLIMTSGQTSAKYVFSFGSSDSCEIWNDYAARSNYSSFTERVLQWLSMANRQKSGEERARLLDKEVSPGSSERIFMGKTFLKESRDDRTSSKGNNTLTATGEKAASGRQGATEQDVETEVRGEPNVETILSREKSRSASGRCHAEKSPREPETRRTKMSTLIQPPERRNSTPCFTQTDSSSCGAPRPAKSSFIADPVSSRGSWSCLFGASSKRRAHKQRRSQAKREGSGGEDSDDDDGATVAETWPGGNKVRTRSEVAHRLERRKSANNWEECGSAPRNQILTRDCTERNQKSINNPNITRTRPAFIRNLLSPQQHGGSWSREGGTVRPGERDPGRPQLHIFMPSMPVEDPGEESMSECGSVAGDVG